MEEVTNNHLKSAIDGLNNFLKNGTDPPADLFEEFILELRISRLIISGIVNDDNITFSHISTDNNLKLLPLFTDTDELLKFSQDTNPILNDYGFYVNMVNDLDFDGIVINCEGNDMIVDRYMLNRIPQLPQNPKIGGFSPDKLKEIADSVTNKELVSFIRDDDNFNNYDELIGFLKGSVMLNIVDCQELDGDTVKRSEVAGFILSSRDNHIVLFTDKESIMGTSNNDENYYVQVSNLYDIIGFALKNDMEGIIINPGLENYHIPRIVLLRIYDEDLINPDLAESSEYAFRLT